LLLAANHKSYLDPPLVGAGIAREIRYFAKKELFRVPLLGPAIRGYGAIPVDRSGFDRRGLECALDILAHGQGLLVFPEGTRIRGAGLARPKEGIGLLALKSGAAILPAYVESSWEPRRSLFRRIPVRVHFGRLFRPAGPAPGQLPRDRYREIAEEVMAEIQRLGEQAGAGPGGPPAKPDFPS
jgi:1-acyl-sn-glycerol-3-phosphate acyltransferase